MRNRQMRLMGRLGLCLGLAACIAMLLGLSGCGGPGARVAPVKGKVVFDGKPVKGGSITFRPVASGTESKAGALGKPATGDVGDDGTFVLSTYGKGDGAVVGKHEVLFTPFLAEVKSYEDKRELPPWHGAMPKTKQVEVKPGSNDITIELVKTESAAAPPEPAPAGK